MCMSFIITFLAAELIGKGSVLEYLLLLALTVSGLLALTYF